MKTAALGRRRSVLHCVLALSLLFILLFSEQVVTNVGATSQTSNSNSYVAHAFSALNSQDAISLGLLNGLTGGSQSIQAYEQVISNQLLKYNIRMVLLDIGWQTYSVGNVPFEQWVANWLTACGLEGVQNVFFVSQLTSEGVNSTWIRSLIQADHYSQTAYANGTLANYVSYDNPDLATAIESDLSILFSYYGSYSSWVGIGTGTAADAYNVSSLKLPTMGYSNSTIALFSRSSFMNGTINNSSNPMLNEFLNNGSKIVMSSGNWGTSSPFTVDANHTLAMQFLLKSSESSILIQWYGQEKGNPGALNTTIYRSTAGPPNSNTPMIIAIDDANLFTNTIGWQIPTEYSTNFTAGYYWIVFSCPSCSQINNYQVYTRGQLVTGAQAESNPVGTNYWFGAGSSILWVRDLYGSSLSLYPYNNAYSGTFVQTFNATSAFSFNTVFLYLNHQPQISVNATLFVVDETSGLVVATSTLSQKLIHGAQGWFPFVLSQEVKTSSGSEYLLNITESDTQHMWQYSLEGLASDPGFQGESRYLLFRLALLNVSQTALDYTGIGQTQKNSLTATHLDALSFTPTSNENLTSIGILMRSGSDVGNYSTGSLRVSIYSSNSTNTGPSTEMLQSVSIPANEVPKNGLANASGFNLNVRDGETYWAVLSASQFASFSLALLGSSYQSNQLASLDNGASWTSLSDSSGDMNLLFVLSNQVIGIPIENVIGTQVSPSTSLAQAFIPQSDSQIMGVYLASVARQRSLSLGDYLSVSIRPDNGSGYPSGYVLAQGEYDGNNMSASGDFVGFSTVLRLQAGIRYWIVLQAVNGLYSVTTDVYSNSSAFRTDHPSALVSSDNGYSWVNPSSGSASIPFALLSPFNSLPTYNTIQLSAELAKSQNFSGNALGGFNAFIQASRLWTLQNITARLDDLTNRTWLSYTDVEPSIFSIFGNKSEIINLHSQVQLNGCSELEQYLSNQIPSSPNQFFNVPSASLFKGCGLNNMSADLNYLRYEGRNFGYSLPSGVLVIGDPIEPINLTTYLLNMFNASYLSLESPPSLIAGYNLSSYSVVIWSSQNVSASPISEASIASYISNGGSFIVIGNPSIWHSLLVSFNMTMTRPVNETSAFDLNNTIGKIAEHTSYQNILLPTRATNGQLDWSGLGLSLTQSFYGSGTSLLVNGAGNVSTISQVSDISTLVENVISVTQRNQSAPIWLMDGNTPTLSYSLTGTPGSPLLLWLNNAATAPVNVSVGLVSNYFGLGAQFSVLTIQGLGYEALNDTNSDFNLTIPAQSWSPIYLIPRFSYSSLLYSTGMPSLQLTAPNQDLFRVSAPLNQSVILAIPFSGAVGSVLLNNVTSIPASNSTQEVLNSKGWFYDNQTHLMTINYISSGFDSIRILQAVPPSPPSFPTALILELLIGLVATELGLVAYLKVTRGRARS